MYRKLFQYIRNYSNLIICVFFDLKGRNMSKVASPNPRLPCLAAYFVPDLDTLRTPKSHFAVLLKKVMVRGKKAAEGVSDQKTLHFILLLLRSRTYARGVLLCPSNVREVRLIPLPPDGEGCALPRTEFYSNCCPVRQRHSHRSPGDCYPPTTTSRSIITTSSTILISSTSPQRRFGRFSFPAFGPLSAGSLPRFEGGRRDKTGGRKAKALRFCVLLDGASVGSWGSFASEGVSL